MRSELHVLRATDPGKDSPCIGRGMGRGLGTRLMGRRMRSRARKGAAPTGVRRSRKARKQRGAGSGRTGKEFA